MTKRIAFVVYLDSKDHPETFKTPEAIQDVLQDILKTHMGNYNPSAIIAPPHMQIPSGPNVTKA